jgi:hypothetical protein
VLPASQQLNGHDRILSDDEDDADREDTDEGEEEISDDEESIGEEGSEDEYDGDVTDL